MAAVLGHLLSKSQSMANLKMCCAVKVPITSFFARGHSNFYHRLILARVQSSFLWCCPYRLPLSRCAFATLAEIEKKDFQRSKLTYFYLLVKLDGFDDGILDNYCQFISSASRMMSLKVSKKFNLPTEKFTQTLVNPADSYKKHNISYYLKRHARMVEVKDIPVEEADIFIQYLQDNVPEGVNAHLQLKKWQDYVSPPDPRVLEQKRLEYQRIRERKQKANEE